MAHTLRSVWRRGALTGLALVVLAGCETQPKQAATPALAPTAALGTPIDGDVVLGMRALEAGDLKMAKQAFAAAIRRRPDDPMAMLGLAETYLAEGDLETALRMFDVLEKTGGAPEARVLQGLGSIALRRGQADSARTYLARSVGLDPTLWRAWLALGQAHDLLRDPEAARRAFRSAEAHAPTRAGILNDIGMSHLSERRPDKALEFFEQALALDPGHHTARANLRIAKAMRRDYDGALFGAEPHELADVLNNVGYIAILNKDFGLADQLLRRAIEVSPVYHAAAAANLNLLEHAAMSATAAAPADSAFAPERLAAADTAPLAERALAAPPASGPAQPVVAEIAVAAAAPPTAAPQPAEAAAPAAGRAERPEFRWEPRIAGAEPPAAVSRPVEAAAPTAGAAERPPFRWEPRIAGVELPAAGPAAPEVAPTVPIETADIPDAARAPREGGAEPATTPAAASVREHRARRDGAGFRWEAPPVAEIAGDRRAERRADAAATRDFRWKQPPAPMEAALGARTRGLAGITVERLAAPGKYRWAE